MLLLVHDSSGFLEYDAKYVNNGFFRVLLPKDNQSITLVLAGNYIDAHNIDAYIDNYNPL